MFLRSRLFSCRGLNIRYLSVVSSESGGRSSAAVSKAKNSNKSSTDKNIAIDLSSPKVLYCNHVSLYTIAHHLLKTFSYLHFYDMAQGTRDFYPDDLIFRNWLFDKWKTVAKAYGYEEYDAPILEYESLYTRKSGEEITEQLFNFHDKGNRKVALRPEMTPSIARMILAKRSVLSASFPLRWFSIPQCWRYEKTSRGRRRYVYTAHVNSTYTYHI